jgi:ubiquinol-cytochrome c reductase iron-sulfur subunit
MKKQASASYGSGGFGVAETTTSNMTGGHGAEPSPTRRDFIHIAAGAAGAVGAAMVVWPLVDQMNPAADTLSFASIEVDLSSVVEGQQIQALWRGKPMFIRHRTAVEIERAVADDKAPDLKDPATDASRLAQADGKPGKPEYLVLLAACTHLGCVPTFAAGEYGGWFCPCHGSHYDTSGRIRKGPAPLNLVVAPYVYLSDTSIKIG